MKVADVCRAHGINQATFYRWKTKFGGMDSSDVKRLRDLEDETRRLKRMYAELSLLSEVRSVVASWRSTYNTIRPHEASGGLSPAAFATQALLLIGANLESLTPLLADPASRQ